MSKSKELTELAIAQKIRAGQPFAVQTNRERKRALQAAKYLGSTVSTRACKGGFWIYIMPSELPN